mmetsp:Transcript_33904/g.84356  ORF Transcript_33904/g.84356 Transcript_33904/m.84356 type:complete len:226 (-) Transcript_33904:354-1031(-)
MMRAYYILLAASSASALVAPGARVASSRLGASTTVESSRRHALGSAVVAAALPLAGFSAFPAFAEEAVREVAPSTSRMGGLVDAYSDITKGWSIYKPSTWNKFDGAPGEYDAKWQDVVGATEVITVSSSPVSSGKGIDALGSPSELGEKVAKSRDLKFVSAEAVKVGPLLMYIVELVGQGGHEQIGFTVSKGKLWRITCKASEKKWDANKDVYAKVLVSFQNKIL